MSKTFNYFLNSLKYLKLINCITIVVSTTTTNEIRDRLGHLKQYQVVCLSNLKIVLIV